MKDLSVDITGGGSRGSWTPEEDSSLVRLVKQHGACNWAAIAAAIPGRSGKSCRLRWINQLDPAVEHRPFTPEEDDVIVKAHATYGNKWATIARQLPGRTDNAIKNHWNATLDRRCNKQGRSQKFQQQSFGIKSQNNNELTTTNTINATLLLTSLFATSPDNGDSGVSELNSGAKRMREMDTEPETLLTLSLPGENNDVAVDEKGRGNGGDDVAVLDRPGLMNTMRRMIEEEVRRYIDGLVVSKNP